MKGAPSYRGALLSLTHSRREELMKTSTLLNRALAIGLGVSISLAAHAQIGTWVYKAHMSTPRAAAGAATGLDGRIYVFGGVTDTSGTTTATAEAYDPATDSWSPIASLPAARSSEAVVTGPDGRIFLIGGFAPNATTSVLAYDPTSNTYASMADAPVAMGIPTAALGSDGIIYVFFTNNPQITTYAYTIATNSWNTLAVTPSGMGDFPTATADPNGLIYVVGGKDSSEVDQKTAFSYDGHSDAWTQLANMATGRWSNGAGVGGDHRVYEFGGVGSSETDSLNAAEAYDPIAKSWAPVANLQTARAYLASAVGLDGKIYAIGGELNAGHPSQELLDTVECYQPAMLTGQALIVVLKEGSPYTLPWASFTDFNLSLNASNFVASIDWGDGSDPTVGEVVAGASADSYKVNATHTYAEEGLYTNHITITSSDGESITVSADIKIDDAGFYGTADNITASSNVAFNGRVCNFQDADPNGELGDYSATIDWGDGTPTSSGTITVDPTSGFDISGTHTYAAVGNYPTTITVRDFGGYSGTLHGTATVKVPPPHVNANNINGVEGSAFSGAVATFTDADPTITADSFTASINWGDGVTTSGAVTASGPGSFSVSGLHIYAEEGLYNVTVTITVGGVSSSGSGNALISDAPLAASGFNLTCKGLNFSNTVAAFTDADPLGTASDYVAAIYWGDGKSSNGTIVASGSGWKVVGTHSYLKRGKYTVIVTIKDAGGATATATTVINVGPVK